MNDEQQQAWKLFATNANWLALHSLDLDRFADFVRASHRPGAIPPDLAGLVAAEGDEIGDDERAAEVARHLDALYDFGGRFCTKVRPTQ
ncbi:MAG TPA: hypothetical protein VIL48_04720 [Acidimicrobiales bacterium]